MISPLAGIRLVALDLDGTLLPASKTLTARAIGVVAGLCAAGIEVTLATGKGWNHTRRYAEELGIGTPLVALEGGFVAPAAGGACLHRRTLPPDTVRALHGAVADLDVGFFYCHDRWRTRAHRRLESWLPQLRVWDPHVDFTDGAPHPHDDDPHEAFGLTLIGPEHAVTRAKNRLDALAPLGVDLFRADFWDGHHQIHARPAGVDKSSGLAHVLAHVGAEPSQMLAAGDWLNDVRMLRMAGVAVAPANAVDEVRAVADHVLPGTCEDDAVVRFLEDALERL